MQGVRPKSLAQYAACFQGEHQMRPFRSGIRPFDSHARPFGPGVRPRWSPGMTLEFEGRRDLESQPRSGLKTNDSRAHRPKWRHRLMINGAYHCKRYLRKQCRHFNGHIEFYCYQLYHRDTDNDLAEIDYEIAKYHSGGLHYSPREEHLAQLQYGLTEYEHASFQEYKNKARFLHYQGHKRLHRQYYNRPDLQVHQHCLNMIGARAEPCLTPLIKQCQSSKIRSTKVIRLHMRSIKKILEEDSSIKVILFIRDPRGIIESRLRNIRKPKSKMIPFGRISSEASTLCQKIKEDVRVFRELQKYKPQNVYLLKYEDLIKDTQKTVKSIYKFIDQIVPQSVKDYFSQATNSTKNGFSNANFSQKFHSNSQ